MANEEYGAGEIYLASEEEILEETLPVNESVSEEETSEDMTVMVEETPKSNVRVSEILELRENNRKVYRMSDGSEQAVFYPGAVHVFNTDTEMYDEMDNTLSEEEDGRHYVGGKHDFVAKFSREEENDELFSVESGMHRVTVSAKKNRKQRNKGVIPKIREKKAEEFGRADKLVFEDVEAGSDYEYSVAGNGVKENILVKEKAEVYQYSFVLHQENVTAEFDADKKRVSFVSHESGEEVFYIPAPFMTDAKGVVSTDVFYDLRTARNGDRGNIR